MQSPNPGARERTAAHPFQKGSDDLIHGAAKTATATLDQYLSDGIYDILEDGTQVKREDETAALPLPDGGSHTLTVTHDDWELDESGEWVRVDED